jgi:hypothetical protein
MFSRNGERVLTGDLSASTPWGGPPVTSDEGRAYADFRNVSSRWNFGYAPAGRRSRQRLVEAAALLVFLTRSARTWIVTSDLACRR